MTLYSLQAGLCKLSNIFTAFAAVVTLAHSTEVLLEACYGLNSGQNFNSRNDLQRNLDIRLAHLQGKITIDVTDMTLSLCHLDIAPRNIIVSPDRSIYLLDWGCVGFYSPVFETWAIQLEAYIRGHPFMKALGLELLSRSSFSEVAQVEALMHVYRANQSIAL